MQHNRFPYCTGYGRNLANHGLFWVLPEEKQVDLDRLIPGKQAQREECRDGNVPLPGFLLRAGHLTFPGSNLESWFGSVSLATFLFFLSKAHIELTLICHDCQNPRFQLSNLMRDYQSCLDRRYAEIPTPTIVLKTVLSVYPLKDEPVIGLKFICLSVLSLTHRLKDDKVELFPSRVTRSPVAT